MRMHCSLFLLLFSCTRAFGQRADCKMVVTVIGSATKETLDSAKLTLEKYNRWGKHKGSRVVYISSSYTIEPGWMVKMVEKDGYEKRAVQDKLL